ncbi:MAG: hypothetical protein ACLUUG_13170 [Lachnospiraceae bacterium]
MSTVTELPAVAEEYGYTVEDYDYFHMPQRDGDMVESNGYNRGGRKQWNRVSINGSWNYMGV